MRAAIRQVSYRVDEGASGSGLPGQGLRLGRVSLGWTARLERGCIVSLVRVMTHAHIHRTHTQGKTPGRVVMWVENGADVLAS